MGEANGQSGRCSGCCGYFLVRNRGDDVRRDRGLPLCGDRSGSEQARMGPSAVRILSGFSAPPVCPQPFGVVMLSATTWPTSRTGAAVVGEGPEVG